MIIKLNVLNYSSYTNIETIKVYIENLLDVLSRADINTGNFDITYNSSIHFQTIWEIINKAKEPLIHSDELMLALNEYYPSERFVILGDELHTENKWGEARGDFFAVIKYLNEKNIWHEIAHLIGAEDHYDNDTHCATNNCLDNNCIMQYGKTDGVLCKCAIDEIKVFLNKC